MFQENQTKIGAHLPNHCGLTTMKSFPFQPYPVEVIKKVPHPVYIDRPVPQVRKDSTFEIIQFKLIIIIIYISHMQSMLKLLYQK